MERFLYASKLFVRAMNPYIYFSSVLDCSAAKLWQPVAANDAEPPDAE
jgi:hypothetical protein